MSWTLCTSGAAIDTAGANTNTTIVNYGSSKDTLDKWSDEAESLVCNECDYDVITNYASLTSSGKEILSTICCAYIAQKIIGYEPESIGVNGAALRLNLLQTHLSKGLAQIKDSNIKAYLTIS